MAAARYRVPEVGRVAEKGRGVGWIRKKERKRSCEEKGESTNGRSSEGAWRIKTTSLCPHTRSSLKPAAATSIKRSPSFQSIPSPHPPIAISHPLPFLTQLLSPGLPRALPVPMHAHIPPTAPKLRRERCSITHFMMGMQGPVPRNGNWNVFGGTRKPGPASVDILGVAVKTLRRG